MKLILQALLLICLLPLTQAYGELSLEDAIKQSQTKEEYVKWMTKGLEQELRKDGHSKEDIRVEIKIKGSLMTMTFKGNLLKDKGFRSQIMKGQSSESESVSDPKAYSLGIRYGSIYLEDGTLISSGPVTK